ncbi:MAG: MFS transporter [Pseudomonadota bacterium]
MLRVLSNRTYRHLFAAQVVALAGTGLATVALGLLAWDLAESDAGQVLGTALAIKMVAYVCVAPVAEALGERIPRRTLLVALDVTRAVVALALPFVSAVWQIYVLIFLLQAASAGFTPTFQATIPDVLPDEEDYTKALSLSRMAYDLESLASPMLAAALLTVVGFPVLFGGTVLGFIASACLVLSVALPRRERKPERSILGRSTRGLRIYLATPRLRALLALSFALSAGGAVVIVNTVVLVRQDLGLTDSAVALTLGAYGAGSLLAALLLPSLLKDLGDRPVMLTGGVLLATTMLGLGIAASLSGLTWFWLLMVWFLAGIGSAMMLTPSGRLLRRSGHSEDRSALFAAQFALSHAGWLVTYPLAGWLQSAAGSVTSMLVLGCLAAIGLGAAWLLWPKPDPIAIPHRHDDLPPDHPHRTTGVEHVHPFVIDDLHRHWPAADHSPRLP